jgi:hypothetical protein
MIWRTACGAVVLVGVAVGVVVLPVEVWVVVGMLAITLALTALIGRDVDHEPDRDRPSRRRVLLRVLEACAAVAAVLALAVVLRLFVLLLLLLVLTSPSVVGRYRRRTPTSYRPPSLRSSTQSLCLEWRASYIALNLAETPEARLRIVKARQRFLDELERRDADGLQAWLGSAASAGGDPGRFLACRRSDRPPSG